MHPQQLATLDRERFQRYREYLDFYHGDQWLTPASRTWQRERRLTFNYARIFIDKLTAYLLGDMTCTVQPLEDTLEGRERARRAEAVLSQVYEANDLQQLDYTTETDTAILGDGCYKVTWDPDAGQVRVTAPDVQGLYAWWAADDPARVWRVATRYPLSAEEAALLSGLPAPTGGRTPPPAVTVTEVWTAQEFQLWMDDALVEQKPNPYRAIPFVIFPNLAAPKQFWGVSDLPPVMEPARELNRALSQLAGILELAGNPIAVLENVEQAEDIAVQPGAIWELPEQARAYLLDLLQGGGVRLHVDYIDLLYRALHDLSEAPRTTFGDNARSLSGVALEMELHPLLQKVRRKRLIRAAAYRRRNDLILRLLEQHTGERYGPYRLGVVWSPVLPQDRSRLVADERALVAAGIHSRRRAAGLLGVEEPEAEFAQWLQEQGQVHGLG
ncbi:MAG: phage portal protein [Chloroflexi bacterium]|nr:phage portal protein [Chloroflexota bacterium]